MIGAPVNLQSLRHFIRGALAFLVLAALGSASPAYAQLNIIASYDSTWTNPAELATVQTTLNDAIRNYASLYSLDNINVRITFSKMSGGLGASSTAVISRPYTTVRNALLSHAVTTDDLSSLGSLPSQTNNPINNDPNIVLTVPNARVLGIVSNSSSSDATVFLNTSIMNLTRPPTNPSFYDLRAVAQHEMDEVLGTSSGVGDTLPETADLFRYGGPGTRSWATGTSVTAFFSVNQGTTNIVTYNQNGQGDYGDWVVHNPGFVQDWAGSPNQTPNLGVELRLLDVIGYRLAPIPEPTTIGLLFAGGAGAVFWRRHRKLRQLDQEADQLANAEADASSYGETAADDEAPEPAFDAEPV